MGEIILNYYSGLYVPVDLVHMRSPSVNNFNSLLSPNILQIAHNSLNRLKQLLKDVQFGGKFANVMDEVSWQNLDLEIRYEEAQLLWGWKEKDHAKRQLKSLLQTLRGQEMDSGNR